MVKGLCSDVCSLSYSTRYGPETDLCTPVEVFSPYPQGPLTASCRRCWPESMHQPLSAPAEIARREIDLVSRAWLDAGLANAVQGTGCVFLKQR